MPLTVLPGTNYQSPLVAVPSRVLKAPVEGDKIIPCEILWGTMGGANKVVNFNFQNNATLDFSQIVALKVDNSLCGATIRFIFPDTSETISIPAYTPDAVIPVFSNQRQFYVQADGPISTDVSRFQILNFLPPPVVVPTSVEQQTAIVTNIPSGANGNTQIIPATVNGTLKGLQIQFGVSSPAADSNSAIRIVDGTAKVIAYVSVFAKTAIPINIVPLDLEDIAVRFQQGLVAQVSGLLIASGEYNINAYYRLP